MYRICCLICLFLCCLLFQDPLNAMTRAKFSEKDDPTREEHRPPTVTQRQKRTIRAHRLLYGHRIFVAEGWNVPWRRPQRLTQIGDVHYTIPGLLQEHVPTLDSVHAASRAVAVAPTIPPPPKVKFNIFGTVPGSTFRHPKPRGIAPPKKINPRTISLSAMTAKAAWTEKKFKPASAWLAEEVELEGDVASSSGGIGSLADDRKRARASSSVEEAGASGSAASSSGGISAPAIRAAEHDACPARPSKKSRLEEGGDLCDDERENCDEDEEME